MGTLSLHVAQYAPCERVSRKPRTPRRSVITVSAIVGPPHLLQSIAMSRLRLSLSAATIKQTFEHIKNKIALSRMDQCWSIDWRSRDRRRRQTAARERAERARAEAQATIHDLQTKLGHANLTQTDLQTAAQRHQDAAIAARAELRATSERLAATQAVRETLQQRLSGVEAECHEARNARQQADAERRRRTLDMTASQAADRSVHQPKTSRKAKDAKARPQCANWSRQDRARCRGIRAGAGAVVADGAEEDETAIAVSERLTPRIMR
jgi:chromosome segregation ATPase